MSMVVNGQFTFTQFVDSAENITDSALRVAFVENYVAHLDTAHAPVIEDGIANFVYSGVADSVRVAGDFNGWGGDGNNAFTRIEYTNFFYYSKGFEPTARLDYKIIVNASTWILDPLNPNTCSGGYGPNSELAMPEYVQPWEIEQYEGVAQGVVEEFSLECEAISKTFNIDVYLPPGYDETLSYATVYVHDGGEYISLGSMTNVLDNLIDSNKIDPVIAVFITPRNRMDEYGGDERAEFAKFVATEVVPYIDENYKTMKNPYYRLTMGASLGGNISGLISFNYPGVFALSGWHSPALWVNDQEVAKLYENEAKDVKLYFNMGTYENLGVDWDNFTTKISGLGYEFDMKTFHEGHSWGLWRATIDDILQYFFAAGTTPINVSEKKTNGFGLGQCFPNPANGATAIEINIKKPGDYSFEVYSMLGQQVFSKELIYNQPGKYSFEFDVKDFDAGVYLYKLSNGKEEQVQRMIVK